MRYDYRRQFKEMTQEQLKISHDTHTNRLLDYTNIGMSDEITKELKILSYIEQLIEKLK